jgi:glycerol-3-phosphate dehydrogenase
MLHPLLQLPPTRLPTQTIDSINGPERVNQRYLPGHPCPPGLLATMDAAEVVRRSEIILVVVPTPFIPDNLGG